MEKNDNALVKLGVSLFFLNVEQEEVPTHSMFGLLFFFAFGIILSSVNTPASLSHKGGKSISYKWTF